MHENCDYLKITIFLIKLRKESKLEIKYFIRIVYILIKNSKKRGGEVSNRYGIQ